MYSLIQPTRAVAGFTDDREASRGSREWSRRDLLRQRYALNRSRSPANGIMRLSRLKEYRTPRKRRVTGSPSVSLRMKSISAYHSLSMSWRSARGMRNTMTRRREYGNLPRRVLNSSLHISVIASRSSHTTSSPRLHRPSQTGLMLGPDSAVAATAAETAEQAARSALQVRGGQPRRPSRRGGKRT